MLKGFKDFVLRGNVVDLAVGVVIGAAFTNVVNSLVKDIISPVVAAIFNQPDFATMSVTVNGSAIMYGSFLNSAITLLIVAFVIYFFVVIPLNRLFKRAGFKGRIGDSIEKK